MVFPPRVQLGGSQYVRYQERGRRSSWISRFYLGALDLFTEGFDDFCLELNSQDRPAEGRIPDSSMKAAANTPACSPNSSIGVRVASLHLVLVAEECFDRFLAFLGFPQGPLLRSDLFREALVSQIVERIHWYASEKKRKVIVRT